MYDFDLCMYIWILDSWSLRGYIIYSFVGFIVNLCNCCYLDSTCIMCMFRRAHYAWWCVFKATSCRLWRDRYNLQGAGFGASQVVSGLRFCRYPWVQSSYRLTLPTDVVEFSVKTILLKISWIDLSSLHFSPYLFASLLLPLRVLSSCSYLIFQV
jgi:hypothetical protein